jgi:flagellar biosynthesis protein FliR
MTPLETLISTQIFTFLLVFARIGGAIMLMPGFSDATVSMNARIYIALGFSVVLTPFLASFLPAIPEQPVAFALLVGKELLVGVFIGLMTQVIINSMNVAGVTIAHVTSLSSAFTFNPQQASQLTVISGFLSVLAVVMIFVTDLHHMLLIGLVDSYRVFPTQNPLPVGDMTSTFAQSLGESFRVGLMMAAPFLIIGFGVFIAMGLVSRLVPQIQIFILSIPIQVITGLIVLMTTISALMLYFLQEYEAAWRSLFTV